MLNELFEYIKNFFLEDIFGESVEIIIGVCCMKMIYFNWEKI